MPCESLDEFRKIKTYLKTNDDYHVSFFSDRNVTYAVNVASQNKVTDEVPLVLVQAREALQISGLHHEQIS